MNETLSEVKTLVDGLTGVALALGAFIAAVYALIDLIRKHKKLRKEQPRASVRKTIKISHAVVILISLATLGGVIWARIFLPDATLIALNQRVTTQAWLAFAKGQQRFLKDQHIDKEAFEEAIRKATFVIGEFSGIAASQQRGLLQTSMALPPVGPVTDDQRPRIFALGLINDVGTCHFIMGRSLEYMGQLDQARSAYQAATIFPYARAWDQRGGGFFWSPAEAALGRLAQMPRQ